MPISNYQNGFPNGVTIKNVPILDMQNGQNNAFWVDSNKGSNENKGTFNFPFGTLLYALTQVVSGQADKIYIAANHEEDITDGTTYNITKRGVQIIGLGLGETRPRFYFRDSASSKLTVSADNCYIGNILFSSAISSLTTMINITGYAVTMEGCLLQNSIYTIDNFFTIEGNNLKLINCEVNSETASDSAFLYSYSTDNNQFIDCIVRGTFVESCFHIPSGLAGSGVKNFFVEGGEYENLSSATSSFFLTSLKNGCSGMIADNVNIRVHNPETFIINAVSGSRIGKGKAGDVFSFSTIIPASKIDGTSAYLLEATSGSFYIEDAIVETDNIALAVGTGIQMEFVNSAAYGSDVFYEEILANLGTKKTVALKDASVVSITRTFENGSRLYVNNITSSTFTGGNVKLSFVLRLLEDGSTVVKNLSY